MLDMFQFLKTEYKDFIILFKSGTFYIAFNEDAYIMNVLLNYQIVDVKGGAKIGFPRGSLERNIDILEAKKINYLIFEDNRIVKTKRFKNNHYNKCILPMSNFYENYTRLGRIIEQLRCECKQRNIDVLLSKIEELLNE